MGESQISSNPYTQILMASQWCNIFLLLLVLDGGGKEILPQHQFLPFTYANSIIPIQMQTLHFSAKWVSTLLAKYFIIEINN